MDRPDNTAYIPRLKDEVAMKFGRVPSRSADFLALSEELSRTGAGYLSQSTLKRLWGYVRDTERKHRSTLDVLARYVGDKDFNSFCRRVPVDALSDSGYASGVTLEVSRLEAGDVVMVSWKPDRVMKMRYEGDYTFSIVASHNTRLLPGMKVRCLRMTVHQPLSLDIISDDGVDSLIYIVGKRLGISWKMNPEK